MTRDAPQVSGEVVERVNNVIWKHTKTVDFGSALYTVTDAESIKAAAKEIAALAAAMPGGVDEELLVDLKEAAKLLRQSGHKYHGGRCEDAAHMLAASLTPPTTAQEG